MGAVLTQNTNWTNVTKAIDALKSAELLSYESLTAVPVEILAEKIRPSGYYNLKAKRLKNLLALIQKNYNNNLDDLLNAPIEILRQDLISVQGIGPETADSIILYAAEQPVFVVDAYTHRILSRHNFICEEGTNYDEIQALFMDTLPVDPKMYNEYHALIVKTGKEYCRKKNPCCEICPLQEYHN